jgi:hypothetical protein
MHGNFRPVEQHEVFFVDIVSSRWLFKDSADVAGEDGM